MKIKNCKECPLSNKINDNCNHKHWEDKAIYKSFICDDNDIPKKCPLRKKKLKIKI